VRPVLGTEEDQQALWDNLDVIDVFSTDHGEIFASYEAVIYDMYRLHKATFPPRLCLTCVPVILRHTKNQVNIYCTDDSRVLGCDTFVVGLVVTDVSQLFCAFFTKGPAVYSDCTLLFDPVTLSRSRRPES
jgi:hypothetical protein